MRASRRDPALGDVREALGRPIRVPTRVLCGDRDMRGQLLDAQRELFTASYDWAIVDGAGHFLQEFFTASYDWAIVDGAGHFLHREQPKAVNRLITDWLGRE